MINVYFCFIYFYFVLFLLLIRKLTFEKHGTKLFTNRIPSKWTLRIMWFVAFLVHDKLHIPSKWSWPERGTFAAFAGNVQEVPRENSVSIAFVRAEIRPVLCQMWGVAATLTCSVNLATVFLPSSLLLNVFVSIYFPDTLHLYFYTSLLCGPG
jgi:hypothetical protein